LRLDHTSTVRTYREADRFSIVRVETTGPLVEAVHKSSNVPALLVSMSLRAIAASDYRLWVDDKFVPTGEIGAFRTNVIDLAAEPAMWADQGIHYVHYHLRRSAIDETAADLGFEPIGDVRLSIAEQDAVLAQITRSALSVLDNAAAPSSLALDHLELILAAHVMQRYGAPKHVRPASKGGLAAWRRREVTEMLRENLDGAIRLADLARACDLSVSHFARSFKITFGVSSHRWLTERRLERAKELLALARTPLVDIAGQCGFGDQAAFTRTFHRVVGVTPGQWRRDHVRPVG